jgi:7-cyano-7-deazaguanine synthase
MGIVTLVSGGLDSTLMSIFIKEEGIAQFPLFIDYGQLAKEKEVEACLKNHKRFELPPPKVVNLRGFGMLISSGLTDKRLDINEDAFLPNRNLLFLLVGSSYAIQMKSNTVAIGLLDDRFHIFPDQTKAFLNKAQCLISLSLGKDIQIISPLMKFSKNAVIKIAQKKGITDTYSCHSGNDLPCGRCIACLEFKNSF